MTERERIETRVRDHLIGYGESRHLSTVLSRLAARMAVGRHGRNPGGPTAAEIAEEWIHTTLPERSEP